MFVFYHPVLLTKYYQASLVVRRVYLGYPEAEFLFVVFEHVSLLNIGRVDAAHPVWKRKARSANLDHSL